MGTNYYTKEETCPTCGHTPHSIHLGKSSGGWQFSFQYNHGRYYKNVSEMREWLKSKKIESENGDEVSHEIFWNLVKEKQTTSNLNHAHEMHREHPSYSEMEFVIDGYSFSDSEFS